MIADHAVSQPESTPLYCVDASALEMGPEGLGLGGQGVALSAVCTSGATALPHAPLRCNTELPGYISQSCSVAPCDAMSSM